MGIMLGVAAALCWGLGDYCITLLTRRVGTPRALLAIQVLSLALWLVLLVVNRPASMGAPTLWLLLVATALCHVLGLVFTYRAFEIGTLSIVSPISAGFAVVTALLSMITGEHLPTLTLGGAAILIGGVILATRSSVDPAQARSFTLRGVPEAILSAIGFGTMFWLFYFYVQPELGFAVPLVVLKVSAVAGSVLMLAASGGTSGATPPRRVRSPATLMLAAAAAGADTLAWLAYIRGTASTSATVVTALASLFSVVTVLLAWRFLRERLAVHQWVGVVAILLGILFVSL